MAYVNFKAGTLEEITTTNKPENLLSFSTDIPSIFKGNKNITNRVIDASLYNNVLGIRKINAEGVYDSEYINMNFARPYIAGSGIDIDSTTNIISIDPDFTIFEIVSSLPVENIQKGKIYLVPSDSSTAQNAYVEYHYLGSGVWEILGEKKSDILNSLVVSNITDYTSDSIIYDVSIGDSYDTAFSKLQSKLKKDYYTKSDINSAGYIQTESDPTVPSHVKSITQQNITDWNNKLDSFTETDPTVPTHVKSITQQNITDWNAKLDSETQLSKGTTTGSGNAVTDISVSNHQITLTKGSTFLTEHQSLKTINGNTITGTGNVTINELPTVSSTDNGKVLQVVNGVWTLVSPVTLYSGTGTPSNSQGNNGDLYMQI